MKFSRNFSVVIGLLSALGLTVVLWFLNEKSEPKGVDFVQHTYAELYHENSNSSSLDKADEIYSSTLLGLIRKEQQQQIASGEIGKLSADPLCNCQDPASVQIVEITPGVSKDGQVTVRVTLLVSGMTEKLRLDLVRETGRWKIDDVTGGQTTSLHNSLIED
ncbi:MAG: DUF3828 domain-containing protein [Limnobacter sp.]|uniref:DUF3828 domain-containing protein n=1 Tax=Limnobacter sp. TaxID=2003368 RepID=UPI0022CB6B51|nr:DUF3828 domain-containing protein [Limnobacter sp.]MCZ8015662.1 DUF3828 domain-containing protein [Limnobacter sp.]